MNPRQPRTSLIQHSLFIFHEEAATEDVLKETLNYLSTEELFRLRNLNKHTHKIVINIIFERRGVKACLYQANIMKSWFNIDAINKDYSSLARIDALFDGKLFTILSNCFLDPQGGYEHKKICCEIMAICLWNANNPILKHPVISKIFMDLLEHTPSYQLPRGNRTLFSAGDVSPGIKSSLYAPVDEIFKQLLAGLMEKLENSFPRKKENTGLLKEILGLLEKVNDERIVHHYLSRLIDCVPIKLGKILPNIHNEDARLILRRFSNILCKIKDKQLISEMVIKCINIINAIKPNTKVTTTINIISLVNRIANIMSDAHLVANLATCLVRIAETHSNESVKLFASAMMREVAGYHIEFPSLTILEHLFKHIKEEIERVQLNEEILNDIKIVLRIAILVNNYELKDKICDFLFELIKNKSFLSVMRNGSAAFTLSANFRVNIFLFDFLKLTAQHQISNIREEIFNYFISKTEVECNAENLFPLFFSIYSKNNPELLKLFLSRLISGSPRLLSQKSGALIHLLDLCVDLPDRLKLIHFILEPSLGFMQSFSIISQGVSPGYILDPLLVSAFAKTPEASLSLITDTAPNSPDAKLIYLYRFLQNAKKGIFELQNYLPAIESLRPSIAELIAADYYNRQYDISFSLPYHFQHLPDECFSSIFLETWHDTILRVSHGNPPKDVPRYWLGRSEEDDAIAEMYEKVTEISDALKNKLFLIANFFFPAAECHRLIVESCLQMKVQQISDQSELCIDAFFQRFRFHLLNRDMANLNVFLDDIQEPASKRFKLG